MDALPLPGAVLARATVDDAPEILVLQRCCWVAEAILNERLDIPALHETLDVVRAGIDAADTWTVRLDGRLVGGVRGHRQDTDWDIGYEHAGPARTADGTPIPGALLMTKTAP